MPKIDLRNLAIILMMAVVGFFITTWLVKKYGD